jgi:predicted enzyme related to lactoylglutathione lyase
MTVKSLCGAILISHDPDVLARFYGKVLETEFQREDHAGLAPHWGVDLGTIHFGIHPPVNFAGRGAGRGGVVLAFDVTSLAECESRLTALGAPCVQAVRDEGFGKVATYQDPDGNLFELVELDYDFEGG